MAMLCSDDTAYNTGAAHPNLHSLPLWSLRVPPLLWAFSPPNLDLSFVKASWNVSVGALQISF